MIQYRYIWTQSSPQPKIERMPVDDVWSRLPEGTPRVAPEERRRQVAVRQQAIARRFQG